MTTFATLLGALPLGVAIVGGLVFSQVLALLVTPALYVNLRRAVPFRAWGRGSG